MADANILQGHIFHDDVAEDECVAASEPLQNEPQKNNGEGLRSPLGSKAYQRRQKPIPAAHRVCLWCRCSKLSYARILIFFLNFNN